MNYENAERDFLLERYKYILTQKQTLNERTFKIVALYQIIILAVATGQFRVVFEAESHEISGALAVGATWGLFCIVVLVSGIVFLLLGAGVAAWVGYRRDESSIETVVFGQPRMTPRLVDAFKWYETYMIMAASACVVGYAVAIVFEILPIIKNV